MADEEDINVMLEHIVSEMCEKAMPSVHHIIDHLNEYVRLTQTKDIPEAFEELSAAGLEMDELAQTLKKQLAMKCIANIGPIVDAMETRNGKYN